MKLRFIALFISVFSFFTLSYQATHAATPLAKVILTSGSVSEREGAIYVAQEHGFFRTYGVDVSFVQVRNGPVGMAALSFGETQFHWGSVSGANLGAIAEGADLVFVAGFINRLTSMFVANPKIKSQGLGRGQRREKIRERRTVLNLAQNTIQSGWRFVQLARERRVPNFKRRGVAEIAKHA